MALLKNLSNMHLQPSCQSDSQLVVYWVLKYVFGRQCDIVHILGSLRYRQCWWCVTNLIPPCVPIDGDAIDTPLRA